MDNIHGCSISSSSIFSITSESLHKKLQRAARNKLHMKPRHNADTHKPTLALLFSDLY